MTFPFVVIPGKDLPSNDQSDMYPQDRVVPVGANTTFCCIVKEGKVFDGIYAGAAITAKRLSRRSYAATLVNLGASSVSGTNVLCYSDMNSSLSGAVVFVGCKAEYLEAETVFSNSICLISISGCLRFPSLQIHHSPLTLPARLGT